MGKGRRLAHMEWTGKRKGELITVLLVMLALVMTGVLCPMTFYLNDDVMMRSILSGAYTGTPDGHAVYMKYPLTGIVSLLYRLTNRIPWFSLMMTGCFWLAVSMVMVQLVSIASAKADKNRKKYTGVITVALGAILCAALFLPHFIYLHYTVAAAVLGGCALFLAVTGAHRRALPLLVLCYCIRSQVFFLLLPFLLVALLWQLCEKPDDEKHRAKRKGLWKEKGKETVITLAFLAGSILICMLWNGWAYRGEGWKQYTEYNDSRTLLYDYEALLPYDQYEEQYTAAGISADQYRIMEEYNIALEESVESTVLEKAARLYSEENKKSSTTRQKLKQCAVDYYYHIRYVDKPYNVLLLLGYLAAAVLLIRQRRWLQLLLTCCMGAGRSLIWLYLLWKGRFPERIYVSLYLLEIMVLAGMICVMASGWRALSEKGEACYGKREKAAGIVKAAFSLLLCCLLLTVFAVQMSDMSQRAAAQLKAQEKWDALTAYCAGQEGTLYLLDVRSMVSYAGRVWEETPDQENYLLAGGWMSQTPLMQKRFTAYGANDGGALLAKGGPEQGALLIAACERDVSWLEGYLSRRFGPLTMERIDRIEADGQEVFYIYRFY